MLQFASWQKHAAGFHALHCFIKMAIHLAGNVMSFGGDIEIRQTA